VRVRAWTMLTFYSYKKCGTCRKAEQALGRLKIDYRFVEITERPPAAGTLRKLARQAGVEARRLFNTSGVQYRALGIKDRAAAMSEEEIFRLLATDGRLVKRPIVTDGTRTTVGFREAEFLDIWGTPRDPKR